MRFLRYIFFVILPLLSCCCTYAQANRQKSERKPAPDSILVLVSADKAEQTMIDGLNYRKVQGKPVRFLHNRTYLLCDSASWNVDSRYIECYGNVRVIQDKTTLKSESLLYLIDENMAKFRGDVVELTDKDNDKLRTRQLNYNTKDSVATFQFGASLKDKDGNVIESRSGNYDAKSSIFTFTDNVQLYMDSIFMTTECLRYNTDVEKAWFDNTTHVWRGDGFIDSDGGSYDRRSQVVFFAPNVYMNNEEYEAWSQQCFFHQDNYNVELFDSAQILDEKNSSVLLAGDIRYERDSLRVTATLNPAMVYFGENEDHIVDSTFVRADTLVAFTKYKCDIPKKVLKDSESRVKDIQFDALAELRAKQAEEREKNAYETKKKLSLLPPEIPAPKDSVAASAPIDSTTVSVMKDSTMAASPMGGKRHGNPEGPGAPEGPGNDRRSGKSGADRTSAPPVPSSDSLSRDTTAVKAAADSAKAIVDSTQIHYMKGYYNVKVYRSDVQFACDSVFFYEVDSIARMYGKPIMWYDTRNQLTSNEMQILMKDRSLHRGSMSGDAIIAIQEDSIHFDQIKCTEMIGYFSDNKVYRYDALGGVSAIYYMVEKSAITTINVKQSKSLTATIKDNQIQKMLYLEEIKSDAYPVAELTPDKQVLKGFSWRSAERPVSRYNITDRPLMISQRHLYVNLVKPDYPQTNKYFDNHMAKVYRDLEERQERERRRQVDSVKVEMRDSLFNLSHIQSDSTEVLLYDTLDTASVVLKDEFRKARKEQREVILSSTVTVEASPDKDTVNFGAAVFAPENDKMRQYTPKELRKMKRAERRAERKARGKAGRKAREARRIAKTGL